MAFILPSIPLLPNPPGTIIPSNFLRTLNDFGFFSNSSAESQVMFGFL